MPARGSYQKLNISMRQQIIELVANEDKTQTEVAKYLGIPRTTVKSIIDTFRKHNRMFPLPSKANKRKLFTRQQAKAVVDTVKRQNDITLKQKQQQIIDDNTIFSNIDTINISIIHRTLQRSNISMKNLDMIPVGRNVQHTIDNWAALWICKESIRASSEPVIFLDEAGFNLHLRRHHSHNVIGKTATISLPNSRGENISVMIALTQNGILHHIVQLRSYNAEKLLQFLNELNIIVDDTPHPIIMDNVRFHKTADVEQWFDDSAHRCRYLPPYSPFLNAVEEAISKKWSFSFANNTAITFWIQ